MKSNNVLPFCDIQDLLNNPEGIIVFSGSLQSLSGILFLKNKLNELDNLYKILSHKFKNDFYMEIQRHNDLNEKQFEQINLKLSNKLEIPLIATHEVFYLDQSMYEAHDALLCIKNKSYVKQKKASCIENTHFPRGTSLLGQVMLSGGGFFAFVQNRMLSVAMTSCDLISEAWVGTI